MDNAHTHSLNLVARLFLSLSLSLSLSFSCSSATHSSHQTHSICFACLPLPLLCLLCTLFAPGFLIFPFPFMEFQSFEFQKLVDSCVHFRARNKAQESTSWRASVRCSSSPFEFTEHGVRCCGWVEDRIEQLQFGSLAREAWRRQQRNL